MNSGELLPHLKVLADRLGEPSTRIHSRSTNAFEWHRTFGCSEIHPSTRFANQSDSCSLTQTLRCGLRRLFRGSITLRSQTIRKSFLVGSNLFVRISTLTNSLPDACELPEVLEELGANGSLKRIRAQAKHRLAALLRARKS
jgi:hypothetical protein